jgi:hypothetical protein
MAAPLADPKKQRIRREMRLALLASERTPQLNSANIA